MDRARLRVRYRTRLIDRIANHVDDTPQRAVADWDCDRLAGVRHLLAAHQAVSAIHGDRANGRFPEVLRNLEHQAISLIAGLERTQDRRQMTVELNVDDSADDLGDASDFVGHRGSSLIGAGAGLSLSTHWQS